MRLFPLARLVAVLGRRGVDGVMQPAMPGRRDAAGLGQAVIDDPAPLEMQGRIDLAAASPVIAIALLVLADQFAEPVGPELGAEGLTVPPGEEFEQELFHGGCRLSTLNPGSGDATGAINCPVRRLEAFRPASYALGKGCRQEHSSRPAINAHHMEWSQS